MKFELPLPDWDNLLEQMTSLRAQGIDESNFQAWMQQWSDIESELRDQWLALLEHTYHDSLDKVAKQNYQTFIQEVVPRFENPRHALRQRVLLSEASIFLPKHLRQVFQAEVRLYDETNTPLVAQERKLVQEAEALMASQMVHLEQPVTVAAAKAKLKSCQDRNERKAVWLAMQEAHAKIQDELSRLFIELVNLRRKIAGNAGFADYRAYAWYARHRFDYSPEDCLKMVDQVMTVFAPVRQDAAEYRKRSLGLSQLMPWDKEVGLLAGGSGEFLDEDAILSLAQNAFSSLDPEFGQSVQQMIERGHTDLVTRPYKATTNHSSYFSGSGFPFVFTNVAGHPTDLRVVLHEFGHGIHLGFSGQNTLYWHKGASADIGEFAAYSLQCLSLQQLETQISFEAVTAIKRYLVEYMLDLFDLVAETERFQHWVYTEAPLDLTPEHLDQAFLRLVEPSHLEWAALETIRGKGWQDLHVIGRPFHNVEYITAWIATLTLLQQYNEHSTLTLANFKQMMRLGKQDGTSVALAMVSQVFPFSVTTLQRARTGLVHITGNGTL